MDACSNCLYKNGKCKQDYLYECNCRANEYFCWRYNPDKPLYSFAVAKQLLFDIAMDIQMQYGNGTEISYEKFPDRILNVVKELDKMVVIEE